MHKMPLYSDTPEHAHAVMSEKETYLHMPAGFRCLRLAVTHDKAFEYCHTTTFQKEEEEGGGGEADATWWVAHLRHDGQQLEKKGKQHAIADYLMAVDMCPPKGAVVTSARLEVHNGNGNSRTLMVCLSEADCATVSVPMSGVPVAALQYAFIMVRVKCSTHPGDVTVRYKVLPHEKRRQVAQGCHELSVYAAPHRGKCVYISMGEMHLDEPPSPASCTECCTMM